MLTRSKIAGAWLMVGLAGCADVATDLPRNEPAETPAFSNGGAFDFAPLAASAACRTPEAVATYQPFDLPAGYSQTIIANEIDDFLPVAGTGADLPDMLTLNETGPQAGRFLYRTHEVGSNGAVTATDLVAGVTSLVAQQPHYESLDGIVWTPHHTLLFAEERVVATRRDPAVPNAVGGLVYEFDPATGITRPLPAVGARSHEGLRFDPQGNLYGISESTQGINGSGAIFKFVPDRRGDLSSGQLYVLKVLDGVSKTGPAIWVALDRDAVQIDSDAEALRVGATGWARPEDIELGTSTGNAKGGQNVMFVATTTDDLVLRIELDGDQAYVSNFIQEGVNITGLSSPDNLALDKQGNLYIAEDNGPGDIWFAPATHARVASGVVRFASLSDCAAEPTGIYFDRSGKTLWVNVQHAGGTLRNDLTVAITRSN
jgi:hypothetical protein